MDKDLNIESFLEKHGHYLHVKTVELLRENGWTVLVSPFYRDSATDKAREADIIAEKFFPAYSFPPELHGSPEGFVNIRLIIECKYVRDNMVFWFDKKNIGATEELIIKNMPIFKPLEENISIKKHHWCISDEAAKLFATVNSGAQERQPENEMMFSAIDKVLNCLVYYRGQQSIIQKKERKQPILERCGKIIHYPVIVFQDFSNLYRVDFSDPKLARRLENKLYFQTEVNYALTQYVAGGRFNRTEYFLVDVIPLEVLEKYLNIVSKDVEAISPFV